MFSVVIFLQIVAVIRKLLLDGSFLHKNYKKNFKARILNYGQIASKIIIVEYTRTFLCIKMIRSLQNS